MTVAGADHDDRLPRIDELRSERAARTFLDAEEVRGSNPLAPTKKTAASPSETVALIRQAIPRSSSGSRSREIEFMQ
jgi:hypothetical protein